MHEEHGALPETDQNAVSVRARVERSGVSSWCLRPWRGGKRMPVKPRVTITANIYPGQLTRVIRAELS